MRNYRPISITVALSKVFEKLLKNQRISDIPKITK